MAKMLSLILIGANGVDKVSTVGQNANNQLGTWGLVFLGVMGVIAGIMMSVNAEKGKKMLIGVIIGIIVVVLATSGSIVDIIKAWVS